MTSSNAPRHELTRRLRRLPLAVALIALVWAAPAAPAQAQPLGPTTWRPDLTASCPTGGYTVPAGIRYIQVDAIGGAGWGGSSYDATNTGGAGGNGAKVTAILPVTPGQSLRIYVGRNGNPKDPYSGYFNGGYSSYDNGGGGSSSAVTTSAGDPCLGGVRARGGPRSEILVVAGGGGGGGGGNTFGSGGNGGHAGANADFSGQAGSDAYHLSSDCGYGKGGGAGLATAAGGAGAGGCTVSDGKAGSDFNGGWGTAKDESSTGSLGAGGAGGGGWYGGGGGGVGLALGGGGGGAGSSYVHPSAHSKSISTDASRSPSVTITPLPLPTTTASTGEFCPPFGGVCGPIQLKDWYTAAPTITLTASNSGGPAVARTYYALDKPACGAANLTACHVYSSPFSVSSDGLHTLTYFSVNTVGLAEDVQTRSFVLTTTSAGVSAASVASGTNPTASTSGGAISVSGSGSGVVGAAVYGANPAGGLTFNSNGAYVDVIASGSGLTSLTITDCHLNGGTQVYWWTGTEWKPVTGQMYNAMTNCVTFTVTSTSSPSLSQLTGTVIASGRPPTITAEAKTADGRDYIAGTWTNQSVKVTFKCSANATPSPTEVTRASDGKDQSASGTCTDGVGQKATMSFTGINVDKTPPSCVVQVSPTVLWAPDAKLVAITGTARAGDTLSGIASVVGGAVTGNEALARGDVHGFAINTAFSAPLRLSADVSIAGQLRATRNPSGSGRTYAQTLTVKDQAGNANSTPCTWTVRVPHDQGAGQ